MYNVCITFISCDMVWHELSLVMKKLCLKIVNSLNKGFDQAMYIGTGPCSVTESFYGTVILAICKIFIVET